MAIDYNGKTIVANYFKGVQSLGGKLTFDNEGISFKSHKLNIGNGEIRIEYSDIEKAEKRGFLTGLNVTTKDGTLHKFVVYHRKDIIEYLESKKG